MESRSKLVLVTCATAAMSTGCYSTWDVAPRTLVQLDGYRAGQKVSLQSRGEGKFEFDDETSLHFRGIDGIEADARFQSIEVEGPILHGVTHGKGDELHVDLGKVAEVQARTSPTPLKTALVTTGVVVGTGATVFGVLMLVAISSMAGGRPLRVAGQHSPMRAPLLVGREQPRASRTRRMHESTRARLFSHWANEASSECASIPAFIALARDLEKSSAPRQLVDAVLRAAREEVTHTELCTKLANQHGDVPISALMPAVPEQFETSPEALLERLVLEAFWDGCVAEGAAAAVARRSLATATDEETRLALNTIAHDEDNHAKLARDIIAFGLSTGGRAIRNALFDSFERKRANEEAELDVIDWAADLDDDDGGKNGLAVQSIKHAARVETWEKSVAMLARL